MDSRRGDIWGPADGPLTPVTVREARRDGEEGEVWRYTGREETWYLFQRQYQGTKGTDTVLLIRSPVRTHGLPTFFGEEPWHSQEGTEGQTGGGPYSQGQTDVPPETLRYLRQGGRDGSTGGLAIAIPLENYDTGEQGLAVVTPHRGANTGQADWFPLLVQLAQRHQGGHVRRITLLPVDAVQAAITDTYEAKQGEKGI